MRYTTTLGLRKPKRMQLRRGRRSARISDNLLSSKAWLRKVGQTYNASRVARAGYNKLQSLRRSPASNVRIQRKKNIQSKKIRGFQITRQLMCNLGNYDVNGTTYASVSQGLDNHETSTSLEFIGAGCPLKGRMTQSQTWLKVQASPASGSYPGMVDLGFRTVTFIPQWPGSKVDRDDALVTLGTTTGYTHKGGFGVKPANDTDGLGQSENFQFNNIAVGEMKSLYESSITSTSVLTNATASNFGNVLNVMNSYITIELYNPHPNQPIDVHIFTYFQKSLLYKDDSGSCTATLNLNQWVHQLTTDTQYAGHNMASEFIINMIRKGKLPSKLFTVLKHRVCHLGSRPCAGSDHNVATPAYAQNGPKTNRKTIKMKFSGKKFFRKFCTNQSELFDASETLQENSNKLQKVMMIALPSQTSILNAVDDNSVNRSQIYPVWYKVHKTNIWTISGNN